MGMVRFQSGEKRLLFSRQNLEQACPEYVLEPYFFRRNAKKAEEDGVLFRFGQTKATKYFVQPYDIARLFLEEDALFNPDVFSLKLGVDAALFGLKIPDALRIPGCWSRPKLVDNLEAKAEEGTIIRLQRSRKDRAYFGNPESLVIATVQDPQEVLNSEHEQPLHYLLERGLIELISKTKGQGAPSREEFSELKSELDQLRSHTAALAKKHDTLEKQYQKLEHKISQGVPSLTFRVQAEESVMVRERKVTVEQIGAVKEEYSTNGKIYEEKINDLKEENEFLKRRVAGLESRVTNLLTSARSRANETQRKSKIITVSSYEQNGRAADVEEYVLFLEEENENLRRMVKSADRNFQVTELKGQISGLRKELRDESLKFQRLVEKGVRHQRRRPSESSYVRKLKKLGINIQFPVDLPENDAVEGKAISLDELTQLWDASEAVDDLRDRLSAAQRKIVLLENQLYDTALGKYSQQLWDLDNDTVAHRLMVLQKVGSRLPSGYFNGERIVAFERRPVYYQRALRVMQALEKKPEGLLKEEFIAAMYEEPESMSQEDAAERMFERTKQFLRDDLGFHVQCHQYTLDPQYTCPNAKEYLKKIEEALAISSLYSSYEFRQLQKKARLAGVPILLGVDTSVKLPEAFYEGNGA